MGEDIILKNINPPPNVTVVNRDYEFTVSYPYPKMDDRIELSGFSNNIFSGKEVKTEVVKESEQEPKTETKNEKTAKLNEKPKVEQKKEVPVNEEKKQVTEVKKPESNSIFLYKGFYLVRIASYKSEAAADQAAEKYFDLGYNAIVEVSENRDGERIYNLNVGDFTSEEFAREFIAKYIK